MNKEVQIHQAISSDIPALMQLDHNYSTDHVWQMGMRQNLEGVIDIHFREIKLPRIMQVTYPRNPELLADEWVRRLLLLTAEENGYKCGYAAVIEAPAPGSVWLTDLVVDLRRRREGVGTQLLKSVLSWSALEGYSRLFAEVQSKNYPAISLFKKFGFQFSGYCDAYFPDQDIALLFVGDCGISGKEHSH
ncbi:MAG: GNAT family N-acetyltransferase [Anaerolineales bacterium]|nr:GNAT family N-acetyltransferase [Anaerolineales bacterium]